MSSLSFLIIERSIVSVKAIVSLVKLNFCIDFWAFGETGQMMILLILANDVGKCPTAKISSANRLLIAPG